MEGLGCFLLRLASLLRKIWRHLGSVPEPQNVGRIMADIMAVLTILEFWAITLPAFVVCGG